MNSGTITVISSSKSGMKSSSAMADAKASAEEKAYYFLSDLPVTGIKTVEDTALFDAETEGLKAEILSSFAPCGKKGFYDKEQKKAYYCLTASIAPLDILAEKLSKLSYEVKEDTNHEYDGVIINVPTGFVPALMNRIYSENGRELWNRAISSPIYADSVSEAVSVLLDENRGKHFSALARRVSNYTDVYLEKSDADTLMRILSSGGNVKIVFVYIQ